MQTIPDILSRAAAKWGRQIALASPDGAVSFAELNHVATRAARAFVTAGINKGDRIAVWAPNMWEWVAAAIGIQRAGGVLVPLNTRLRGGEVANVVRRGSIRLIVSIGDFLGRYYPDMLRGQSMPTLQGVIVLGKAHDSDRGWDAFLASGDNLEEHVYARAVDQLSGDDLADIMFTSGTTGAPKGAIFNHARSVRGGEAWQAICGLRPNDRYCCFGPFSHNASYKAGWVSSLIAGATLYWPAAYDPESILSLIADNRINVMPAPPTIWVDVLAHPKRVDWNTSSLRYVSTGATTIPPDMVRRLKTEMKVPVVATGYGMTECCGTATMTRPEDADERVINSVGRAIDGTSIRIVSTDGIDVPAGQAGEILIRDDKLFTGYLDDPIGTRSALDEDGWLHSGDIGVLDASGYLSITDRLKDMYIVGGFNVYPAEIEKQMSSLPGLRQCAVVGVPDGRLGEVGHAFIVRSPQSTLDEGQVVAWCRDNMANYKVPRAVSFVDELPMNTTGKILKHALRQII